MPNAAKPGPEPLLAHPETAPEAAFDPAEASENAARRLRGGPARNARLGEDLQSATPQASDVGPQRRLPLTRERRRGVGSRRAGVRLAGAPSPAPPAFARAAAAGPRRSWAASPRSAVQRSPGAALRQGPGSPAGPSRRAKRRRPAAWVGAAGGPPRSALARHPTRSAVFTKAPGTAESRRARRLKLRLRATPLPCSRPPAAQRPPCGARGDGQGLRPLRPGR